MSNTLKTASQWLHDKRKTFMSETAVYTRGLVSIPSIYVTKGKTDFQVVEGDSSMPVEGRLEDFIIHAADLIISGAVVRPLRGDKITLAGIVYEVLDMDGGCGCWKWEDQFNEEIRIHTKRTAA
jgi:hypothetical protein